MTVVIGLLVLVAAAGGVAAGRAWGRAVEQAAYARQQLDELRRAAQAGGAPPTVMLPVVPQAATGGPHRWSDVPPRGAGLPESVQTDARVLVADVTRHFDRLVAHGQPRDVPPPPPVRLDIDDAMDVDDDSDDPPQDETRVTSLGDGEQARYRYPWPTSPASAVSARRGVMPRSWWATWRRITHRPRVRIRRLGGEVAGWAPGQMTAAVAGVAAVALAVPSERLVRDGAGVHRRRRQRREQRLRQQGPPQVALVRTRRSLAAGWRDVLRPQRRTTPPTMPSVGCTP